MIRNLAFFLLGAAVMVIAQGIASPEVQLEHGQCRFGKERNGTFYENGQYTRNYLTPSCASIALADKWASGSRWGWRVAYIWTGAIQARDNVAHIDEGNDSLPCNPPVDFGGCKATFNGSGRMRGVSFSGTGDLRLGPVTATAEMGFLFFKSQFKAVVTPIDYPGRVMEGNEESKWWDSPIPLAGLTLRYGNVYIAARHYWPAEHRALSLTDHSFTQISAGLAWKL